MDFSTPFLLVDNLLSQPWHWSVSGLAIAMTLFLMTWMGKSLSVSSTFEHVCGIIGMDRWIESFKFDYKQDYWRIAFVLGIALGGALTIWLIPSEAPVQISPQTQAAISDWGIKYPTTMAEGRGFVPGDLFNWTNLTGILMAIIGGFLIGFGSRYAKGCTSGHAITGLSHLQLPSLITVIGFFIGGVIMTWVILPIVFP